MEKILLEILIAASALALVLVRAVRLEPSAVSDFELEQEAKNGNPEAKSERFRRKQLPQLKALQAAKVALLTVVVITAATAAFGPWWGMVLSLAVLGAAEFLGRRKFIARIAQNLFTQYEPLMVKTSQIFRPFVAAPKPHAVPTFSTKPEFEYIVDKDKSVLTDQEKRIIVNALSFTDKTVRDIMTPVSKIEYVQETETAGPLLFDQLHKTGFSIFPVKNKAGKIAGLLWLEDVVPLNQKIKHVHDAMRTDLRYVHAEWPLERMVQANLHSRRHLFIVVDDKNVTVGIVTMSDLLNQLLPKKPNHTFAEYDNSNTVANSNNS